MQALSTKVPSFLTAYRFLILFPKTDKYTRVYIEII